MPTLRCYMAWPFKALTMGCVVVGVISMIAAKFIEEGLQGRTVKQFLAEVLR